MKRLIKKLFSLLTITLLTCGLLWNAVSHVYANAGTSRDEYKIMEAASIAYQGDAKVIAFHISFPNDTDPLHQAFVEGDTAEALQEAIGMKTDGSVIQTEIAAPYESIYNYYQRASLGKLSITGDVYSYEAKLPKDSYVGRIELYQEAMAAFDSEIDYSDYDGDGDGRIDAIYLHVPFDPKDRWGSEWWPSCHANFMDQTTFDGVTAGSAIVISRYINTAEGHAMIIHETGHALGFPDLYSNNGQYDPEGDNTLTGTMSYDMMDQNLGEFNGFHKMIAGWLTEKDITRVFASEYGLWATRDSEDVGTKEDPFTVTLDLSAYTTDEIDKTGGVIVVGNDAGAPFSDYFLIQYENFAGNEKVYYDQDQPIPPGFRVFRVHAQKNDYDSLIHNNSNPQYSRCIELVDPDIRDEHISDGTGIVPRGITSTSDFYSCMYYDDMSITPTSFPSSNFYENIEIGFSGISIEFLETHDNYGTLRISYSDENKPEEKPLEFTQTDAQLVPGGAKVTLQANQTLTPGLLADYMFAKLTDPALISPNLNPVIDGDKITLTICFDTDLLMKDSEVFIQMYEESFIMPGGKPSPAMTVPVSISQDLIDLSESGYVKNTAQKFQVHTLTPILKEEDGSYYFYEFTGQSILADEDSLIHKYVFTAADPTDPKETLIPNGTDEHAAAVQIFWNYTMTDQTDNISLIPEGADLGDYPYALDSAQIGDYIYVVSMMEYISYGYPYRIAVTKLDADGNVIEQITPACDEVTQEPKQGRRALIQEGPNQKIAVTFYSPRQMTDFLSSHLAYHSVTFFLDRDLNVEGRLDNYSTGAGTWLPDGRYISFSQRDNVPESEEGIPRKDLISYDITTVIDPPEEDPSGESVEYKFDNEDSTGSDSDTEWTKGSTDPLTFTVHRNIDDASTYEHFLKTLKVFVNDTLLSADDYTAAEGSLIITLNPSYLETLAAGEYELHVVFDDGEATTTFKIFEDDKTDDDPVDPDEGKDEPAPEDPDDGKDNPDDDKTPEGKDAPITGDPNSPWIWISLIAVALCLSGIGGLVIKKRRE